MSTLTNGSRAFVVPYIAGMTADGSAFVNTLGGVTVTVQNVDYVLTYTTTTQQAIDLLNAFVIENYDQDGGKNPDIAMNFTTNGTLADAFKAVVLDGITAATDPSGVTLQPLLQTEIANSLANILSTNGILDLNEAAGISGDFALTLDASGGAANMNTVLTDDTLGALKYLYLQIPYDDISGYKNAGSIAESATLNFLPLKQGSVLNFVFDVSSNATVEYTISDLVIGSVPDGVTVSPSGTGITSSYTDVVPKRVAIAFTLDSGSGYFGVTFDGTNYTLTA